MPRGEVKSFSQQKGYGFLSNKTDSYFFHVSDLPDNVKANEVKRGMTFDFDDTPSPKGMQAKDLVKVNVITAPSLVKHYIVRRESEPKQGEVILRVPIESPFSRDPQACRDALINGAKDVGCNAVLSLTVNRETWSSGNYNYTMHSASADLCLVIENKTCLPSEKEEINKKLNNIKEQTKGRVIKLVGEYQSKRFWQRYLKLFLFAGAGLIILLAYLIQ